MKILVVTDVRFWRKKIGSQQRIYKLISDLRANVGVDLKVYFVGGLVEDDKVYDINDYHIHFSRVNVFKATLSGVAFYLRSIFFKLICFIRSGFKRKKSIYDFFDFYEFCKFDDYFSSCDCDVVILEYLRLNYLVEPYLGKNNKLQRFIVDTHDLMYKRCLSLKDLPGSDYYLISREKEFSLLNMFDSSVAIQLEDFSDLLAFGVKNVIYYPYSKEFSPVNTVKESKFRLGFIGSDMQSNVHGLSWFLEHVFQHLAENIELVVAGSVCSKMSSSSRVTYLGKIDDLSDFYSSIDVSVNPVFYGSGLKIKSIESISYGVPLLATKKGVEGMVKSENSPFVVLDSASEWVEFLMNIDLEVISSLRGSVRDYYLDNYSLPETYLFENIANIKN